MKLYLASTLCWHYPLEEVLKIAYETGFEGVEVWAEHVWFHETLPEKIKYTKEKYNLDLTFHAASWDLNLCSLNKGIQLQSVKEVERSMELAKAIGANNVTVSPGRRTLTSEWTPWHFESLIQNLRFLADRAQRLQITLSLEHTKHERKEFMTHPISINSILDHLPEKVMTTFDISNVPLYENPLVYYEKMKRINKIHLSDATTNTYHTPLGTGQIDLSSILPTILKTNAPIVMEGYDESEGCEVLQANLRYLYPYMPKEEIKSVQYIL
ncbi:sugar phosphate isomerase/epimerase family protein [Bacillus taeanensis]|nr:sugar phosphate isomerase/epimerase [Bacillus taeanensis]